MTKPKRQPRPTWRYERRATREGFRRVAGVDEVGRGSLAGPVIAAAVILRPDVDLCGLDDSKRLSPERRVELAAEIRRTALAWGVGIASAEEIDRLNVLGATHLAARRAVEAMSVAPDCLLTDNLRPSWAQMPVEPIVRGDQKSASVAAASILAKVERDELMRRYDREYPEYGFARHKGYPTPAHIEALRSVGPSTIHRLSFRGLARSGNGLGRSRSFKRLAAGIGRLETVDGAGLFRRAVDDVRGFLPEREIVELSRLLDRRVEQLARREEAIAW